MGFMLEDQLLESVSPWSSISSRPIFWNWICISWTLTLQVLRYFEIVASSSRPIGVHFQAALVLHRQRYLQLAASVAAKSAWAACERSIYRSLTRSGAAGLTTRCPNFHADEQNGFTVFHIALQFFEWKSKNYNLKILVIIELARGKTMKYHICFYNDIYTYI